MAAAEVIEIEVRQPTLGELLASQEYKDDEASIGLMIARCFVPGTDVHVYETADIEMMKKMPWDDDLKKLQNTIAKLSGVNVEEEEEKLKKPQTGTQPSS